MQQTKNATEVTGKATLFTIGSQTILKLPMDMSAKLPSRGMVLVEGTLNDTPVTEVLEPDGRGSHWFVVTKALQKAIDAAAGDTVTLAIHPSKDWPEPPLPADLAAALKSDKEASALWQDVTPMARWDWIRWIRATNNPQTRERHIEVAFSKLKHGIRRPCCFNRSMCTDFSVSKNGILLEPTRTSV